MHHMARVFPTNNWRVNVSRVDGSATTPLQVAHVNASTRWMGRTHAVAFTPEFDVTPVAIIVVQGGSHLFEWQTELWDVSNTDDLMEEIHIQPLAIAAATHCSTYDCILCWQEFNLPQTTIALLAPTQVSVPRPKSVP